MHAHHARMARAILAKPIGTTIRTNAKPMHDSLQLGRDKQAAANRQTQTIARMGATIKTPPKPLVTPRVQAGWTQVDAIYFGNAFTRSEDDAAAHSGPRKTDTGTETYLQVETQRVPSGKRK